MRERITKRIVWLLMLTALLICSVFFVSCKQDENSSSGQETATPVFTLDKTSIELTVDGNLEILTLTIANVEETPEWTSTRPSVATVTVGSSPNKATVKGVAEGTAVITATAGENVAVCTVTVKSGPRLELVTQSLNLLVGRTGTVEVETNIESGLTYTSDNPSVATVNADGLVTGISGGTANITVSGGNKSVVCPVTVVAPYVTLDTRQINLTVKEGENTYQLTAESNGDVEWISSDPAVATVSGDGLVTALAQGEAIVTARYASAEDTCTVKVKNEILTVTLSETEKTLDPAGTFALMATIDPEQEGEDAKVVWSVSSGDDIVSVDEEGNVTSLGAEIYGTAVIRATSVKDPDAYAECTVTVPDPYADWIEISDKASLEEALKSGNESKNMYLTGDIDLGGATISSTLGYYAGTFEGRGYELMNFTCGNLFGGITADGVIKELAVTCTVSALGGNMGIFGLEMHGTVENCRLDITFGTTAWQSVFGRNGNGTIVNTVLLLRNPSETANVYAGFCQTGKASWQNTYYAVYGGTVAGNGPTLKTDAQLRSASQYENYDGTVWNIEEGEIPVLKNGGNIGEVKVELDRSEVTVHNGDSFTLNATVTPSKLSSADKAVTWESSDLTVATVEDGRIVALKEGTVTITVRSVKDPEKTAVCVVTVDAATEITLVGENEITLEIGGEAQITVSVNQGGLVYSSENPAVATVDENGKIVAVSAGETSITVSSDESTGKYVTVSVTVMPEVIVGIEGDADISMEIGETHALVLTNNREDDNGTWSSSDAETATVENGVVSAIKAGTVTITYTSAIDPGKTAVVTVTVQPEIVLSAVSSLNIKIGVETELNAIVSRGELTYASSDEEILLVTADGKVTGLKAGAATVTVTSVIDPTKTAQCEITVSEEVEITISLDKERAALDWGETLTLIATVNVPGVRWESSDPTVVTVENGSVTAMNKDGEAVITAISTEDPTKTATCTVTVAYIDPVIEITAPAESAVELEVGDEITVQYTVTKGSATVVIEGGEGILSLNGDVLKAVSAGTVTVKVVSDEKETVLKTFSLTVLAVPTLEITNKAAASEGLRADESLTLTIDKNREDGVLAWSSSDEGVATVDENGRVTALTIGTAVITVTFTTDSGRKATDTVTIEVYDETSVSFALAARSVAVGKTYTLDVRAVGGKAVFVSDKPAVATVDENGVVKGMAIGKTVITATIEGTEISASIIIQVYSNTGATEISTAAQLKNLSNSSYVLVNDIDFEGVEITNNYVSSNFLGNLDGMGYSLKNIKANFTDRESGFIGILNGTGTIQNINFINFEIGGNSTFMYGGLIRQMDGNGTVKNCYFEGVITARGTGSEAYIGPIGAKFGAGSVENCIFNVGLGDVAANSSKNGNPRAMVARWIAGNVVNCYANGELVNTSLVSAAPGDGNSADKYASAFKSEEELKQASLYDSTWETSWVIVDGSMPVLKSVYVTEPLKVKLEQSAIEIYVGQSATLTAVVTPTDLDDQDKEVTWESSDSAVAAVEEGVITALKEGIVTITVRSVKEPEKTAACTVTVKAIEVSIDAESVVNELRVGAEKQFSATVNQGEVVWETSSDEIATVEDGLVTALSAGTVTITVRSVLDPTQTDSVTIEIKTKVEITVALSQTELALDRDGAAKLTATLTNSENGVIWTSDNESVATVDENGNITTYGQDGTARITATSVDDDGEGTHATAVCVVSVQLVPVTLTLNAAEKDMFVGGCIDVSDLADVSKGTLILSVISGDAVTVENGLITAVAEGTATVRLTSSVAYEDYEAVYAEIVINVTVPAVEMKIDVTRRSLHVGGAGAAWSLVVTMDPMPADAAADDLVWSSSNPDIVSVSGGYLSGKYYGNLTTKAAGLVTITASYSFAGQEYTVSCEIDSFVADRNYTSAVSTVAQVKNLSRAAGLNYYLANDIDFEGVEITTNYIGNMDSVYLDGRGYSLKNIKTNFTERETGFISMLVGLTVVENVNFVNFEIGGDSTFMYGGLIRQIDGSATLKNCYFEGVITARGTGSEAYIGPIGAKFGGGSVENCIFNVELGDVAANSSKNGNPRAMVARWIAGNVVNCYANGDLVNTSLVSAAPGDGNSADKYASAFKSEEELKQASLYDESWSAWVIVDGALPHLRTAWDV